MGSSCDIFLMVDILESVWEMCVRINLVSNFPNIKRDSVFNEKIWRNSHPTLRDIPLSTPPPIQKQVICMSLCGSKQCTTWSPCSMLFLMFMMPLSTHNAFQIPTSLGLSSVKSICWDLSFLRVGRVTLFHMLPFATCGNDQCRSKDLCVLTSTALPSTSPSSPLHAPFMIMMIVFITFNSKPRQNGRTMTSFRGTMAKLGAGVDNELSGSALHQCR